MQCQSKVREVYPAAFVSATAGQAVVYSAPGGEPLGQSCREYGAWEEIERRGTHHQCPYCGIALEPFMGAEDGPATGWYHPDTGTRCHWDDYENLGKRQVSGVM